METINLREVKRLSAKMLGKQPPDDNREFLFYYSVWTFIQNKQPSRLEENQVSDKLKQYPAMEIYYCRLPGSPDDPPVILKGRKINKQEINDHEDLSELIYQKTGVTVPESDLRIRQKAWMQDDRPFIDRIRDFTQGIQKRDEMVKRLKKNIINFKKR